jgi:hypothetical protein
LQKPSSRRSPWDEHRLSARLADQGLDLAGVRLLGRQIVDGDVGAFAGVGDGGGAAHAGIAAGDQSLATLQAARADIAVLAMVRARRHLSGKARPRLGLRFERRLGIFFAWILHSAARSLGRLRASRGCHGRSRRPDRASRQQPSTRRPFHGVPR